MPKLSRNFHTDEFRCRDGTRVPAAYHQGLTRLCRLYLEPLRAKYGRVTVNSGYRTAAYNARIGGASRSFHIYTMHGTHDVAADITCARGKPSEWHATLNAIRQKKRGGKGGLGLYGSFCHIDMRDYPASWKG